MHKGTRHKGTSNGYRAAASSSQAWLGAGGQGIGTKGLGFDSDVKPSLFGVSASNEIG